MRELTVNRQSVSFNHSKIEYTVETMEGEFVFRTPVPHCLKTNSKVILRKEYNENECRTRMSRHLSIIPTENVFDIEVIDENSFIIRFDDYVLLDVVNYAEGNRNALEFVGTNIYNCVNNEHNIEVKSFGNTYYGSIGLVYDETTGECVNEEDFSAGLVFFNQKIANLKDEDKVYLKFNWHFKEGTNDFDDINIKMFEYGYFITPTVVGISESTSYKVDDDNVVGEKFLKEISNVILPDIVDNEKRQFLPAMAKGRNFKLAQGLEFNLHFRSRVDLEKTTPTNTVYSDSFKTTDVQIWNNLKWADDEEESKLEYMYDGYNDDIADELNQIGFTEDDIKYQKTKLKKTFLRLLFYSSKNMLDRELLYYSTIFLDTGDLYAKYGNIKNITDNAAFDPERIDKSLRLSASFSVKNKYDTTKSSEGFYLYLFPNEVEGKNASRTIYMKVEFNHAGYGKTIPMMLPRDIFKKNSDNSVRIEYNNSNYVLNSTSDNFPTSFLHMESFGDDEGVAMDIERYTDSIMIPVNIIYDKTLKSYLYYFPWYNRANENKIVINLWEPRVRGGINGDS